MIKITAADGKTRCSTCGQAASAVDITLGNREVDGAFSLCRSCAQALLNNLQRKEVASYDYAD